MRLEQPESSVSRVVAVADYKYSYKRTDVAYTKPVQQ